MSKDNNQSSSEKEKLEELKNQQTTLQQELEASNAYMNEMNNVLSIKKISSKLESDGSNTGITLKSAWPNICFESEINSKDTNLKKLISKYLNEDQKKDLPPFQDDLGDALSYLELFRQSKDLYDNDAHKCIALNLVNSIFPGSHFKNISDLLGFLEDHPLEKNLITALTDRACSKKNLPLKMPDFDTDELKDNEPNIPIGDNKIFNKIEEGLKKGRIVSIAYSADIFNNGISKTSKVDHGSTIIGDMKLCDEEYYILRNTWGKESCENKLSSFLSAKVKDQDKASIDKQFFVCIENAKKISLEKFLCNKITVQKEKNKCIENVSKEISIESEKCQQSFLRSASNIIDPNFYCDENGNYIVKKSLIKQTTGAYYFFKD